MSEPVIEHAGFLFPLSTLKVLLAQSASAEVRRRFEGQGDTFDMLATRGDFQQAFLDSYVRANLEFMEVLRSQTPPGCRRILDIGCGLGLLDLLLYRAAEGPKPELFLFDKSVDLAQLERSPIAPTGFNATYVFTASLQHAAMFLELNGVDPGAIHLCEVGSWDIAGGAPFDLVFSRKSWGFHFPLSQYLDAVAGSLAPQGVAIMDVRAGTGGEALLRSRFAEVQVLRPGSKSALVAAHRPV